MSTQIPLEPGHTYHIWTHANGEENLFRTKENYLYFLKKYVHHIHPVVDTFAYCLMPNHLHFMVRVKSKNQLKTLPGFETLKGLDVAKKVSKQFSNLFNSYTQAYNKLYDRKGSLFIPGFKRKIITSDQYFVQLIAYIHNNPIHHGFTENLDGWPYSSWKSYLMKKPTLLKRREVMHWFGTIDNYKNFHQNFQMTKAKCLFERE